MLFVIGRSGLTEGLSCNSYIY